MPKEYGTIEEVTGPIMLARGVQGITYDETGEIELVNGEKRRRRVLEIGGDSAMVQLYEVSTGVNLNSGKVCFLGRTVRLNVSENILSRMFDGMGKPTDGDPDILPEKRMNINGLPMNPVARSYPEEFIQTGVFVIDGLNTLVRGQKLPIFSASGLPHANLTVQITRQTKVCGIDESLAAVFTVMDITFEETNFFMGSFRKTGVINRSIIFISLVNDPTIERIATPRIALIAAEYLAFEENMHVLVILTDITNYADSLCEISAAREEIPGCRDYPGYIYTDLASLYEGAGCQKSKNGSITTIPILTMSENDKTHPILDLTGYIIEGQIILSRELYRENVTLPIDVLSSLFCLKNKGISEDRTRTDHADVINQLFAAYARGKDARELMTILGKAALTNMNKLYAKFAGEFEKEYTSQNYYADYDTEEAMEIGWKLPRIPPGSELKRIKDKFLDLYYEAK